MSEKAIVKRSAPEPYIAVPKNMKEAFQLADVIAKSGMVPAAFNGKPAAVFVAMQYATRLGLDPLAGLQNIAVVNGKPTIYGDGLLAVVQGRADFVDIDETADEGSATCTVTRRGRTPVSRTFTVEDAQKAGLWGKAGPWKQYPKRMLQMRARSWAVRDCFSDALSGLAVYEELRDIEIAKQPEALSVPQQAKAALRAKLAEAEDAEVVDAPSGFATDGPPWGQYSLDKEMERLLAELAKADNELRLAQIAKEVADVPFEEEAKAVLRARFRARSNELRRATAEPPDAPPPASPPETTESQTG